MAKTISNKTKTARTTKAAAAVKAALPSREAGILLGMIETDSTPWSRPWVFESFSAAQPRSWRNRPYHGSNSLVTLFYAYLAAYAASIGKSMAEIDVDNNDVIADVMRFGFSAEKVEMRFATFRAIKEELEGSVKKGAKSAPVIFFRPRTKKEKKVENGIEKEEEKVVGFIKVGFNVFPLSAAEGINESKLPKGKFADVDIKELCISQAKEFVKNLKDNSELRFVMEGNRAFWTVGTNIVHTPKITQFKSEGKFWEVIFHEIVHWTGDKSRLDRSDFPYEQEELVAELGSWEICRLLKIPFDPGNKKAYLKNWLSAFPSREKKLEALDEALKAVDKAVKFLARTGKLDLSGDSEDAAPSPETEAEDSATDLAA